MNTDNLHDLELLLQSHVPLIVAETLEERRVVTLFRQLVMRLGRPLFHWSVTDGVRRMEFETPPNRQTADPVEALKHIRACTKGGVYLLADFHPYLDDAVNIRLLKEIALNYAEVPHTLVLVSHRCEIPPELRVFTARFDLALPEKSHLEEIVREEANRWCQDNGGRKVQTDRSTLDRLVQNLAGLTARDARRLARGAIRDDGAITETDLPTVMEAKYRLLDRGGALSFEYDTARFSEVGGLSNLKSWLQRRRQAFAEPDPVLAAPKGILLVGVQGGGKSLAAKAVAGLWGLPLLRLDFGSLYNKFFGETERNLREAIKTAEVMSPCVLWIDEIEKAVAQGDNDGGVSQRILGTLLTWMAENRKPVFIVATANAIDRLPPELVRKGRLDEIFFVDLPDVDVRRQIFEIHLRKRGIAPAEFDLDKLATESEGFSGAEIEQAVVSGLYLAREQRVDLNTGHVLAEIRQTRPLSTVMSERLTSLRAWAKGRTVMAD